jgi:hypothetical protein
MLPLHKLAAQILVWGILLGFSTLIFLMGGWWAIVGIICFSVLLYDRVMTFKFVYENTREHDGSD